jgi:sn-glycerol 3-phosphate transport system substrate-binding protein
VSERIGRRRVLGGALGAAVAAACPVLAAGCRPSPRDARALARLWFAYGGKNRETLERLVGRFNASQAAVRVEATFQGDYFEALAKLRTAIAARAAPAVSHVVGEVVPYLHEAGALEPLAGYPGAADLDLVPALAQSGTWLGGADRPLVALPFNRSTPIMYLNRTLLEQAGVAPPTTWQQLERAAAALTVRSLDGATRRYGFECPISWWFWVALVQQGGGTVMEPDGTPTLGGEAGVRAIELWQRMVHDSRTMRPPPGRDYNAWEVTNQDFLEQRAAIIYTSTAFLRHLEGHARFPVLAMPLPGAERRAVPTGGTFFVMLRAAPAEEKRAGWELLRWMMAPEQTIEWATSTGYMPVARDAVLRLEQRGYYAAHPNDRVAMDQLGVAQPWPWAPPLFRVQRECVDPLLEEAVLVPRPAREVLAEARRRAAEA